MYCKTWSISATVVVICFYLASRKALAHKQLLDSPSSISRDDYPESQEKAIDKDASYNPKRLSVFSDDGNDYFKIDPSVEDTEEKKMASFEVKKRTARTGNGRRSFEFPSSLARSFAIGDWGSLANGRKFRRPFVRKSFMDRSFLSSPTGNKRPYYYSEPEGSEFLGGPGK